MQAPEDDQEGVERAEDSRASRRGGAMSGKIWLAVLVAAVACLAVIAVAAAQSMVEPPHPTLTIT